MEEQTCVRQFQLCGGVARWGWGARARGEISKRKVKNVGRQEDPCVCVCSNFFYKDELRQGREDGRRNWVHEVNLIIDVIVIAVVVVLVLD